MFDNIRFLKNVHKTPYTQREFKKLLEDASELSENTREYIDANSEYQMSGRVENIAFCLPDATCVHMGFLLQFFCIITADEKYFTKRSNYNSFLILYTYDGNGILEYDGRTYSLSSGDGFFIDCRKPHFYHTDGNYWKQSSLHFTGEAATDMWKEFYKGKSVLFHQPTNGGYQSGLEKLLQIYQSAAPYRDLQCANQLSQIITELLMEKEMRRHHNVHLYEYLQDAIVYMEHHYMQPLTLGFFSEFFGISKYHFAREFRKFTGVSPNEYVIRLRMAHAKYLLQNTNLTIREICEMIGIADESHFASLFKKREGISPGKYRKGARL